LSSCAIVSGSLGEAVAVVVVPPVVVVSVVVVPVVVPYPPPLGGADDVPSWAFRFVVRPVSDFVVRAAFGRNFFTLFGTISLCATTVAICGAAQFGGLDDPAAVVATMAATAQAAARVARR
jgi:hypothetical protein